MSKNPFEYIKPDEYTDENGQSHLVNNWRHELDFDGNEIFTWELEDGREFSFMFRKENEKHYVRKPDPNNPKWGNRNDRT